MPVPTTGPGTLVARFAKLDLRRQVLSGPFRPDYPPTDRIVVGSIFECVEIRLRLAGVKPNSEAIRIMISAWRLAAQPTQRSPRRREGERPENTTLLPSRNSLILVDFGTWRSAELKGDKNEQGSARGVAR
jgi:hypothetical protein